MNNFQGIRCERMVHSAQQEQSCTVEKRVNECLSEVPSVATWAPPLVCVRMRHKHALVLLNNRIKYADRVAAVPM